MQITEGTIVDKRFRIGAPLGSGAMGSVYAAQQLDLERDVAIKFLSENAMFEAEDVARFHREAQLLSTLNHRNIVRVYAFGKWGPSYYMVMERIDGTSLDALLKRSEPLAKNYVFDVALQLCDGLAAAHAENIVHRDIKPSNIIIAKNGDVKIIDLGFAKVAGPTSRQFQQLTEAGTAIGTVLYMSPESCNGESVDHRADIYSVGAVLHHCLTGKPPFTGNEYLVVMRQQISEQIPRLSAVAPEEKFSQSLQNVIDNATAKKRTERYQTITQMREDLERAKRNEAVILRSISEPAAVLAKPNSNKKPIGIAVLISALLSLGVLYYFAHHPGQSHSVADEGSDMLSALEIDRRRILNRIEEPHSDLQAANLWADLAETYLRMVPFLPSNEKKRAAEDKSVRAAMEAINHAPFREKWSMFERLGPVMRTKFGQETAPAAAVSIVTAANAERNHDTAFARLVFQRALKYSLMMQPSEHSRFMRATCMAGILVCDRQLQNRAEWQNDINECMKVAMQFETPSPDALLQLVAVADIISLLKIDNASEQRLTAKLVRELKTGGDFNSKNYSSLAKAYVLTSVGLVRNDKRDEARELMLRGQKYAYLSPDKSDLALFKRASTEWGLQIPEYKPDSKT